MTVQEILQRTRTYIRENFLYMRPDFPLGDDDRLLAKGVVDSMGVAEVLGFIETEFGITLADEDVTEENLGTLNAIARFVAARVGAANSAAAD